MKPKTILVCGLPGAGKTYFATRLKKALGDTAVHVNGDDIRKAHNDWDFSEEGRLRQAKRMKQYADAEKETENDDKSKNKSNENVVDPEFEMIEEPVQ